MIQKELIEMTNNRRLVLGLSGGVDSAVAMHLLLEQGYEVIPVFLKVYDSEAIAAAMEDARRVCEFFGIEPEIADVRADFESTIITPFVEKYLSGATPNPCVYCNYLIKWRILYDYAQKHSAAFISTGHYSGIIALPNGRYSIRRSANLKKDQSYVMYHLPQEILRMIYFPLEHKDKAEVRRIALELGIPVASKKDSQEICFVSDNYIDFIDSRISKCGSSDKKYEAVTGKFVMPDGSVLGEHKGIHRYTVGQRKGLGISYKHPLFVLGRADNGKDIVLGENSELFCDRLTATNVNYMAIAEPDGDMRVEASIRYGHRGAVATIRKTGADRIECIFDEKQRAVTSGQAVVFYNDNYIVAGGIIE